MNLTEGRYTEQKSRPDTLNIEERSKLALNHLFELADKRFNYVNYIGAALCEDPPHFVHHKLGWTEALPYSVHGVIVGRNLTGLTNGEEIQRGQRSLMLSHFTEMDGFVHVPKSPWNDKYPMDIWEQARTLYALIYCFLDSGEEELLKYADGIVDGLFAISRQEGSQRIFDNTLINSSSMGRYAVGSVIDPLIKYYEMTGNTKAFQVAEGTANFLWDTRNGFFDEEGRHDAFFRTVVASINGFSKLAALTGDPGTLEKAKRFHDYAISRCTAYGSTPCCEPVCSDLELNLSALSLICAGYDEYWDQIDRFIRNQIVEAQFLDKNEWVKEKATKKRINRFNIYDFYPDDLQILPYDDYENILERSVGGFMWATADEHMYFPASLMVCCTSHALRSFEIVWQNAIKENYNDISVNFHYNFENDLGEIISYEPYEGKTAVILKKDKRLRIRIPEYALKGSVVVKCDDKVMQTDMQGRYVCIPDARKGRTYTLEYDLNKRTTEENQLIFEYPNYADPVRTDQFQVEWRGNTVIRISPESKEEKRMYKRSAMDTDKVPYKSISHYITSKRMYD